MTETAKFETADFFADADILIDPYKYLASLSEHQPVYLEPHHGVYMITGYEEALTVFRDTATYSNVNIVGGPDFKFSETFEGDDMTEFIAQHHHEVPMNDQIITFDPPQHTDHRALVMGLITPKRLKENEDFMWRLADQQLDVVLPLRRAEIIDAFAQPYTLLVIADLLGVPEEDHADLLLRMGIGGMQAGAPNPDAKADHQPLSRHYPYFIDKIGERRIDPKDDVLTGMAQATFPDGRLPEPIEVARIAANLFAAGQETTVRLIGATLQRIADDPEIQRVLRADRALIPKFIEETLRMEGPIKGAFRLAVKASNLGGVDIPVGANIMILNGGANRDARQFPNPDDFDYTRSNVRRHVAFGYGVHTCPGSPLARSEVRVTIERLFDRTANISVAEDVHGPADNRQWDYMRSSMFRALNTLTLEFTPKDS